MVAKKKKITPEQEELKKRCSEQLASLYAYFGKLLYESMERKIMSFRFTPQYEHLEHQADEILKQTKYCPQEEPYYELFKAASTALLKDQGVTQEEKMQILGNLFSKVPGKAAGFLFELVQNADPPLKRDLIDLFKNVASPVLIDLYAKFINEVDSFLRVQGVIGLSILGSDQAKAHIISAASDREPYIRRLVVNCLDCHGSDDEVMTITKLTNDADENVARIAIRKLGRAKIHLAFVHLITKLGSPNIKIRKEAIEALRFMAGTDLGYWYSATESDRQASIERWKRLWQQYQKNPHFLQEIRSEVLSSKTHGSKHGNA